MLVLLNKPYQMLSQFNPNPDYPAQRTLQDLGLPPMLSPIGRLDYDSEGLLLLSDDPPLEQLLIHPKNNHPRTYLVQVEGTPLEEHLSLLRSGGLEIRVKKKTHRCAPTKLTHLHSAPSWVWPRTPPVDKKQKSETNWLELTLTEGKNRQVRRMTAQIGHPTLRLIRTHLLHYSLTGIPPGKWRALPSPTPEEIPPRL